MGIDAILRKFEMILITALLVMMAVVVTFATVDLAWIIVKDILSPPVLLLDVNELLEIFGIFLLALIGLELLETIHSYYLERTVRVEVVIIVALIAIARKVIIVDYKSLTSFTLFDVGAVILGLSIGYYLIRRSRNFGKSDEKKNAESRSAPE